MNVQRYAKETHVSLCPTFLTSFWQSASQFQAYFNSCKVLGMSRQKSLQLSASLIFVAISFSPSVSQKIMS